ncbi:MAG TPA: methyltransferase domain-containing protein [Pseudonocardia sp.]
MSAPVFDAALEGHAATLVDSDGARARLAVHRWRRPADADDAWLLDRCTGPTVDLGCGPGRLLVALRQRSVSALGVDHSPVAQAQCGAREVVMVRRDVFARVPGEGRWRHVLLADGNIGIGGDAARLLARAARMVGPGGSLLVETDPEPDRNWRGSVRVDTPSGLGPEAPWARVGAAVLCKLAASLCLRTVDEREGSRSFVQLQV